MDVTVVLRRFLIPGFLLALPCVAVAACSVSADASSNFAGDGAEDSPAGTQGEAGTFSPDSAQSIKSVIGSPLCGMTCSPDDVTKCGPSNAEKEQDASIPVRACRIVKNAIGQSEATTACTDDSADVRGVDGTSCKSAGDCAPGFDCVDGEKGAVCRCYCCAGSCEGNPAQNGGPTFCDVQPVVRPTPAPTPEEQVKAPVCMPIKACTLLEPGGCGRKESCAVVTGKGVTGCVSNGTRQAGESCEDAHCAEGLTCLGSPGDRTCYKLCRMKDSADCGPTQKCTTGSTFQDTSYGVCRE